MRSDRRLETMHLPNSPAAMLWRALRDDVRRRHPSGRVLIAVDGMDGAGKTVFADNLAIVLAEDGSAVYRASLDDFHRPRAARYRRGRTSPEGHYLDSYDYATFRRVLADPFRGGGETGVGFQLRAFDLDRDVPREAEWESAPRDAYLIVDGLFALRPGLRELWDTSVWLEVPVGVATARMAARDGTDPDPGAPSNRRYRDGFALYLADHDPRGAAAVIVDNTDPAAPSRLDPRPDTEQPR